LQRKIPISTERSPEEQARYENARNRAQALRRFYEHLILFAIVNLGLFLIDFFTSPGSYWFYWVTLGRLPDDAFPPRDLKPSPHTTPIFYDPKTD
jgi:hypothetical protein